MDRSGIFAVFCALALLRSCTLASLSLLPSHGEPCPADSYITLDGFCKCDHSLCDKPACVTTLLQIANATDIPGLCCPRYACEGCPKEERIDSLCPCLPGAVIRSGRTCKCVDPYKTVRNGTCVCDPDKCELPDLCEEHFVSVRDIDGCCERVRCLPCPDDSYPTNYSDAQLEDKCVCFPCSPYDCNDDQRPNVVRRGRNVPGMCCDIYKCEDIGPNKGCVVNGTTYADGETWNSPGDDRCKCQNGISFCSPADENNFRSCISGGKVYNHMDTWVEDICTNCTCTDGEPKCIAHMCEVRTSEVKKPQPECPPLVACKKVCEYGFKVNKLGCKVCKCKASDKAFLPKDRYVHLDALLKEYNLTEGDVIHLVKNSVPSKAVLLDADSEKPTISSANVNVATTTTTTTSTSTVAPSTTICITSGKTSHGDCIYSCVLEYAVPGFAAGLVFGGALLFVLLKCLEKNRQKYKMAYTYKPVGKEAVDRNLNFSPIIKTKNLELQSYNEKKNAI